MVHFAYNFTAATREKSTPWLFSNSVGPVYRKS